LIAAFSFQSPVQLDDDRNVAPADLIQAEPKIKLGDNFLKLVIAVEKCFCIHAIHGNKRSEAISQIEASQRGIASSLRSLQ
jgi:hypothetical protein